MTPTQAAAMSTASQLAEALRRCKRLVPASSDEWAEADAALAAHEAQAALAAEPVAWRFERLSDGDVRVYAPDGETWLLQHGQDGFYGFAHRMATALAATPAPAQALPDPSQVICPSCSHQFRAIPGDVQQLMLAAGFEPPFVAPAQAQQAEPFTFPRRWRIASDGFGLQRDDADGCYVHFHDAVDVLHRALAATKAEAKPLTDDTIDSAAANLIARLRASAAEWMPTTDHTRRAWLLLTEAADAMAATPAQAQQADDLQQQLWDEKRQHDITRGELERTRLVRDEALAAQVVPADTMSDWCRLSGCSHRNAGSPVWEATPAPAKAQQATLDPAKVQLCRVGSHNANAMAIGQPCNCPEGTCRLWNGGLPSPDAARGIGASP